VTIPEADIFHCGDTYWNGIYPFIDYSTGGNIDGMIKAAEANVGAVTDKTIVIPGHGNPVSNKAELSAYREMLVAIRDNVSKLRQQGRSLDETIAAKPTAAFDAKWGQFDYPGVLYPPRLPGRVTPFASLLNCRSMCVRPKGASGDLSSPPGGPQAGEVCTHRVSFRTARLLLSQK
jgi:hypothetical protein